MTGRSRDRFRVRAGALAALVVAGTLPLLQGARPQQDRWYEHYERALRAIDRSDWPTAIGELNEAVSQRDESRRSARTYGVRFVRYFPYYYLGLAHFGAGDDDEARRYLNEELGQEQIQRIDELESDLRVLLETLEGPDGIRGEDRAALAGAERDRLLADGLAHREAGRWVEAMEALEGVLAIDPDNGAATEVLRSVRLDALGQELASFEVQTRGGEGEGAEASPAALFEAKAREIFQRGVALMAEGDLEAAMTRFELTLAFLEDEGWTGQQLYADAQEHKRLIRTEVRRAREADLRARLAADAGLPQTPPEIMLISPTDVDEPLGSELVRIQGVAHDIHGVAEIHVEVNGEAVGDAQLGVRQRGIGVVARADGGASGLGTFAQFSKDLALRERENRVVVRVTNVNGQTTDITLDLELEAEESRIFAAVIGVGAYADDEIPDLAYAAADAEAFRRYLSEELGVPDDRIFTLLDEDATYANMRRLFRTDLRRNARENDQVLIYYAGHGAPDQFGDSDDGDGVEKYLLPHDTDVEDISGTGYPMEEVAEALSRLQAGRVIYIADACFSGASGGRTLGRGGGVRISDGFLGRLTGQSPGRVILSASGANEPSLESQALGHGVFTYFLLEALGGAADTDGNLVVTVPEVFSYVSRMVPENTGRRQHPTMSGELGGEMVLARVDG